jgi:GMC oxidoreductase
MDEGRLEVLRAIADTVVPSLERSDDPDGFWLRSGSDVGAHEGVAQALEVMPPAQRDDLGRLLDGLSRTGFLAASRRSREQLLRNLAAMGSEAAAGGQALAGLSLFFAYGLPDAQTGANPFWSTFGYPGPGLPNEPAAKTVTPLAPEDEELTLEADAVVIGSGAGGGVIAAALAEAGQKVIVLEAGGLFDESDFNGYELWAYQNVSLYAGSTYGGGTTINWTNCLRTKPWVREGWARDHGLEGVDGPEFDRHLDAVWERIAVSDRCSHLNGTQTRMKLGAQRPCPPGACGTTSRRTSSASSVCRCTPAAFASSRLTRWGPAGWAATPGPVWPAPTASCTMLREFGSATPARSPRRAEPTR